MGFPASDGTFVSLKHYPPLYSLFLSIFVLIKVDLIVVNQVSDGLLFGLFVFLMGYLFHTITSSKITAICLSIITASSLPLIKDFTGMMSEPLAIITGFPGFLLLLLFIIKKSKKYLYLSAILCGMSFAARYAFFAFPLTGLLLLFIYDEAPWKEKLKEISIFLLISIVPMLLWFVIGLAQGSSIGGRYFYIGAPLIKKFIDSINVMITIAKSWLPYKSDMIPGINAQIMRPVVLALFILLVIIGYVLAIRQRKVNQFSRLAAMITTSSIILFAAYFAVFEFSYLFVSYVDLYERLITPFLPSIFMVLLGSVLMISSSIQKKLVEIILAIFLALLFLGYNFSFLQVYQEVSRDNPNGYASPVWREDKIFPAITQLPLDSVLVSNAPDILLFYTNRNAVYLSKKTLADPFLKNINGELSFNDLMDEKCAFLVLLNPGEVRFFENKANPINEKDYSQLVKTYKKVYSSAGGIILESINCPNIQIVN